MFNIANIFSAESLTIYDPQPQSVKNEYPESIKIMPEHKFICFACAGNKSKEPQCEFCESLGYLTGDHPMLKIQKQGQETQKIGTQGEISVHRNFVCDGCEMDPIEGVRYNCKECNDYDLCQKCYNRHVHHHTKFQKIGKSWESSKNASPAKIKLSKAFQKQKLMGNGKSYFSKISHIK